MITKDEIITCKSYIPLCDYLYDAPNLDDIPPTGLVHVPLDQIEEFFRRVDSNGHKYVVVSSCSDYGLALQREHPPWKDMIKWANMQVGPSLEYNNLEMQARLDKQRCIPSHDFSVKCHSWTRATIASIPDNIHHWFLTNLMFIPDKNYEELLKCNTYEKITAIPFGVAEGKHVELYEAMQLKRKPEDRENKIYISWNDYTYERCELRDDLVEWSSYSGEDTITVRYPGEGQDKYEDYLKNLGMHKYVVSPPGNGADCYRTLESVYMGCLTFVEDTPSNRLANLPVYRYKSVEDIMACYNGNHQTEKGFEERPEVKLSHWRKLIHSKRSEIF